MELGGVKRTLGDGLPRLELLEAFPALAMPRRLDFGQFLRREESLVPRDALVRVSVVTKKYPRRRTFHFGPDFATVAKFAFLRDMVLAVFFLVESNDGHDVTAVFSFARQM